MKASGSLRLGAPARRYWLILLCAALGVAGCKPAEQPAPPAPPNPGKSAPSATTTQPAGDGAVADYLRNSAAPQQPLPAGHPPVSGPTASAAPETPAPPAPMAGAGAGAKLLVDFRWPESWKQDPSARGMRAARFVVPRAEGDDADGEVIVFFFGPGGGGSVKDNIDRWVSQFKDSAGQPVSAEAVKQEKIEGDRMNTTLVDISGTYAATPMAPNAPATAPKPNQRMLGAIVEFDGGPYFIRFTGPEKTVAAQRDAFVQTLKTAKVAK